MTPVALREVLSLPAPYLAELPAATTLVVRLSGSLPGHGTILLTTSPQRVQEAGQRGQACLTPLEYEALAEALADGRLTARGALAELHRKVSDPGHRIDRGRLMGGRTADGRARGVVQPSVPVGGPWTVGELCQAIGAEVEGIEGMDVGRTEEAQR